MNRGAADGRRGAQVRIASVMLLVLLVGVVLALVRYVRGQESADWHHRVLAVHVVLIAVVVPLGAALLYSCIAADVADPALREARTALTFAVGAVAWAFVLGSLGFWSILMLTHG